MLFSGDPFSDADLESQIIEFTRVNASAFVSNTKAALRVVLAHLQTSYSYSNGTELPFHFDESSPHLYVGRIGVSGFTIDAHLVSGNLITIWIECVLAGHARAAEAGIRVAPCGDVFFSISPLASENSHEPSPAWAVLGDLISKYVLNKKFGTHAQYTEFQNYVVLLDSIDEYDIISKMTPKFLKFAQIMAGSFWRDLGGEPL